MSKNLVMVVVLSVLTFAPQLASAEDAGPEIKSRNTAFAYSAVGSAVSLGLMAGAVMSRDRASTQITESTALLATTGVIGALILPSAGEIYAGKPLTWGMGIRAAAVAAGIVSVETFDGGLATLSMVTLASGIVYDIATAGSAVDDYNQRLHLRVTPTVLPTASSGPAVGLGITGSF